MHLTTCAAYTPNLNPTPWLHPKPETLHSACTLHLRCWVHAYTLVSGLEHWHAPNDLRNRKYRVYGAGCRV